MQEGRNLTEEQGGCRLLVRHVIDDGIELTFNKYENHSKNSTHRGPVSIITHGLRYPSASLPERQTIGGICDEI
jgi:hypothetical protein